MKPIKFFLFISVLLAACNQPKDQQGVPENALNPDLIKNPASASSNEDKTAVPTMTFESDTHDFGTIDEGEKISYAFKFKNTGNTDLVIRSANGSCGCTVPEWPKDPIKAGDDGVIKVTFDSKGKTGMQHKTVTIIANTIPNTTTLNISGEVIPEKK